MLLSEPSWWPLPSAVNLEIDCRSSNVALIVLFIHSRHVFRFVMIAVIVNTNNKCHVTISEGTIILSNQWQRHLQTRYFSTKYAIKANKWPNGDLHCYHWIDNISGIRWSDKMGWSAFDGELIGLTQWCVVLKQNVWEILLMIMFLHGALLLARPVYRFNLLEPKQTQDLLADVLFLCFISWAGAIVLTQISGTHIYEWKHIMIYLSPMHDWYCDLLLQQVTWC